ncbi:MAG: alpha amylase catalytic subunit [Spirochaetales bacterium]|nr:alpha amylase catalytic subunit [Spirochaetales bacterium]
MNQKLNRDTHPEKIAKASYIYSIGLLHVVFKKIIALYEESAGKKLSEQALAALEEKLSQQRCTNNITYVYDCFPAIDVYKGKKSVRSYISELAKQKSRHAIIEDLLLIWTVNRNPVFEQYKTLFSEKDLISNSEFEPIISFVIHFLEDKKGEKIFADPLIDLLLEPARKYPDSLIKQLRFLREKYGNLLGELLDELLISFDLIREEEKIFFPGHGPSRALKFTGLDDDEHFTSDLFWMPQVVLLAKSTLVWLDQLSRKYRRHIHLLEEVPDEELELLASWGFNALWLIGLWERSEASRTIKISCGNQDAAASAYSLYDYQIAAEIGGWDSLHKLREKASRFGIRLASDMVPNHTGIVSDWVYNHPDRFIQSSYPPFPGYTYNSQNLSGHQDVGIFLEDHYYQQSDAAVTFKRVDFRTGDTCYIYHGNDGTHMPWNDTAQLDFLNPETREAVIQTILHVAANFRIIRFDAAMTLAKKHIQRLWYPTPGSGGDIPSRSGFAVSDEDFHSRIPREFWQEVVERINTEIPDTLLIAEAFWMMEGYFVRTLGMHRVYNSAFMHMMKNEDNEKYRLTIKNTIEFDPQILKRFVNFMNNPDEETAAEQFGCSDKYIGVCTAMVTMPGLPMFGHGQIEGFYEKYGMEFRRAYRDEQPNNDLVERHKREIFPLMRKRYLFAEVDNFLLYDFYDNGSVNQNVYAYSNIFRGQKTLVFFNNNYYAGTGTIHYSAEYLDKGSGRKKSLSLGESFSLPDTPDSFCLFEEFKSGLCYIQRSSQLRNNGFFTELNGYQIKVFINFREVRDDDQRTYETLYNMFPAGIYNLERQIRLVRLMPLHSRFDTALRRLDNIRDFKKLIKAAGPFITDLAKALSIAETENMEKLYIRQVRKFSKDLGKAYPTDNPGTDFLKRASALYPDYVDSFALLSFVLITAGLQKTTASGAVENLCLEEFLQEKCLHRFSGNGPARYLLIRAALFIADYLSAREHFIHEDFRNVFSDSLVKQAINVHEYDGTVWFDGSLYDELLFMVYLADEIGNGLSGNKDRKKNIPVGAFLEIAYYSRYKAAYKYDKLISI